MSTTTTHTRLVWLCCIALGIWYSPELLAHAIGGDDQAFINGNPGLALVPFTYFGAKHMFTGIDHLLYLAGIVFFVYRLSDVALYVSLFALGHSLTLLAGVLGDVQVNPFLVDAIIGLSVVYKAFENIGGFDAMGIRLNPRIAVWCFGLCHGLGLATKLQAVNLDSNGLIPNLVAFNVGVELGQLAALAAILFVLTVWRTHTQFARHAMLANWVLMTAGFTLFGYQLNGFWLG